jgi:murein DD-endopeptidase MepM/ murein hydrolase activator NlpD
MPLDGNLLGRKLNGTHHGRSVYRKKDVPGHNVIIGYSRPGTGDAVDFGANAGESVYAVHSGSITRVFGKGEVLEGIYITSEGNKIVTVYAHTHLKDWVKLGSKVVEGQVIGYVGRKLKWPHLHFEMWIGGKAISNRTIKGLAQAMFHAIANTE